ncbi:hypothetical protein CCYA_CCYA09G2512 [Cyanidiococcus yangmingshanensis]|nr:hypothetical protein CCYA_CCYA09G2512 [Cyanidiococcus yangmingshanensis]
MATTRESGQQRQATHSAFVEFRVVLLAGDAGSRMRLFTDLVPKCMLPIGNRPLLFYALYSIERSGLSEVILVTTERALERVTLYVEEFYGLDPAVLALRSSQTTEKELAVRIEAVPDDLDSAEAILRVAKHLDTDDVLILSADAFGHWDLATLTTMHRVSEAAWTMLLTSSSSNVKNEGSKSASGSRTRGHGSGSAPGGATIATSARDYFVIDEVTQRVLYVKSFADASKTWDRLRLPRDVLRSEGPIMVHRDLVDLHIYVCRRWVLELLRSRPHMTSLRSDLLPYLVRNQFVLERRLSRAMATETMEEEEDSVLRSAWRKYLDMRGEPFTRARDPSPSLKSNEQNKYWIPKLAPPPLHTVMTHQNRGNLGGISFTNIRCQGCFASPEYGRLFRVNTIHAYIEANRLVAAGMLFGDLEKVATKASARGRDEATSTAPPTHSVHSGETPASEHERPTTARLHIGKDCLVASESVQFGAGCTIKNQTVIGAHTILGSRCKVSACVIMDHVRIGSECTLQNCVIGSNVQIHDQCQLRDCLIGPDTEVAAGTHETNEIFTRADIPIMDSFTP